MKGFIKEYRLELLVVLIALIGIIVLVNPFNIRAGLFSVFEGLKSSLSTFKANTSAHLSRYTATDILGWLIIFLAMVFGIWRGRYRFLESKIYGSRDCPKCGSPLKRTRRKRVDRIISTVLFIPFHRYICSDYECGWIGLRKPGRHHRRKKSDEEWRL